MGFSFGPAREKRAQSSLRDRPPGTGIREHLSSYLVEVSVGDYDLTERTADNGISYYEAQDDSIPAAQQQKNLVIMNQQENITEFESLFNGTYPFTSDGVIVGTPAASFEEEMQTMITFAAGA